MTHSSEVCIIGCGPRGLSVLERLCANAAERASGATVTIHVVDPYLTGAGAVWRRDQHRHLLMNTVASQVSVYTDASVEMAGPLVPGPSLIEWAGFLALMDPQDYDDQTLEEARRLGPDSYPTRAFYGEYLGWVFRRLVAGAPPSVRIELHRARAVRLDDAPDGTQRLLLNNGERLDGIDTVVLALGHVAQQPTAEEQGLAAAADRHGLRYVAPANPADVDLSGVTAGEPVLLRGLGLCFFDYLALLTEGRGGTYERVDGRLRYQPSGREPMLYAGSRRGVPHHARGENQKGAHGRHVPRVLTPPVLAELGDRAIRQGGLEFRRDLWPLIAKEVETVYYTTLVSSRGCRCDGDRFAHRYLAVPYGDPAETAILDDAGIDGADRWDWRRLARPAHGRPFDGPVDFDRWLIDHLAADVAAARGGNVGDPVKAALDVLRDLRNEIRLLVDHRGLTGSSYRDELQRWYTPLNAFLSIGPPASRIEQAGALIEARVLRILGPDATFGYDADAGQFTGSSPVVPGSTVGARTLIEARLPEPDVRSSADPLLRYLMDTGQADSYRIGDPDGSVFVSGGLAVTERPFHLVTAAGYAHPARFAFGVPTESVHWVTAAGIRPGVNSVTLADADAIARTVLDICGVRPVPTMEQEPVL